MMKAGYLVVFVAVLHSGLFRESASWKLNTDVSPGSQGETYTPNVHVSLYSILQGLDKIHGELSNSDKIQQSVYKQIQYKSFIDSDEVTKGVERGLLPISFEDDQMEGTKPDIEQSASNVTSQNSSTNKETVLNIDLVESATSGIEEKTQTAGTPPTPLSKRSWWAARQLRRLHRPWGRRGQGLRKITFDPAFYFLGLGR